MSEDKSLKSPSRRSFFKTASVGAVSAAAIGLAGGTAEAALDEGKDRTTGQYRETEHVKTVYALSRF